MTALQFAIYDKDDPTGTLLATIARPLGRSMFRTELNGTGYGVLEIHRDDAQCTAANFADGNYVLVTDTDLAEAIGGFFLPRGTVRLLSENEKGDQTLIVKGDGTLSYIGRAIWWKESFFDSGNPLYQPRSDGSWHFPTQKIGNIYRRGLAEAQEGARPIDPIPALTYDFDADSDSAGDAWLELDGDMQFSIGTDLIDSTADLIKLGLTVLARPDFLFQAYQNAYGTDRHSSTFASGKIRFAAGLNIAANLDRTLNPDVRVRKLLVKGQSSDPADMVIATDSGAPATEGFLSFPESDSPAGLAAIGAKNILLRQGQSDTARFPIVVGDDEANGFYTAGWPGGSGHFWLGDTVTVHTGTGEARLQRGEHPGNGDRVPDARRRRLGRMARAGRDLHRLFAYQFYPRRDGPAHLARLHLSPAGHRLPGRRGRRGHHRLELGLRHRADAGYRALHHRTGQQQLGRWTRQRRHSDRIVYIPEP